MPAGDRNAASSNQRTAQRPVFSVLVALLAVAVTLVVGPAPAGASNDDWFGNQWALSRIGASQAWSVATGSGVKIGIVDTGVDLDHQDLAAKVVAHTDCTGEGPCQGSGDDDNGHGTHVAGIAAAVTGNGPGVAGVAPNASLVVAKALDENGSGVVDDVIEAIVWTVDQGAKVVNLSLGPEVPALGLLASNSIGPGIEYAWNHGAVPVLASGNDPSVIGGSNYRNVNAVVVGATGPSDEIASYSSSIDARYGIVAPGGNGDCRSSAGLDVCIVSTYIDNGYALQRGTSMATPHVSGAAAVLFSQGHSRDAVIRQMLDTANKSVKCGASCSGRLDLAAAVGSSPAPSPAPTTPTTQAPPDTSGVTTTDDGGVQSTPASTLPPADSGGSQTGPSDPNQAPPTEPAPASGSDLGTVVLPPAGNQTNPPPAPPTTATSGDPPEAFNSPPPPAPETPVPPATEPAATTTTSPPPPNPLAAGSGATDHVPAVTGDPPVAATPAPAPPSGSPSEEATPDAPADPSDPRRNLLQLNLEDDDSRARQIAVGLGAWGIAMLGAGRGLLLRRRLRLALFPALDEAVLLE